MKYKKFNSNNEIYSNLNKNLDELKKISGLLDWSDIGDAVGKELGKYTKSDIDLFLSGLEHGISSDRNNKYNNLSLNKL